jgi:hypothetical protein
MNPNDSNIRLLAIVADRLGEEFMEALLGHLPNDAASQARLPELLDTLHQLARLESS